MGSRGKRLRAVGIVLYAIGILAGLALAGAAVWADVEAEFYGFPPISDHPLHGLKCPILMTTGREATVALTLKNPTTQPMEIMLRTDVSSRGPLRSERTTVSLPPGGAKRVTWGVTSADVDLGFFVFVQVSNYPAYPLPFRQARCGIVVLDVPVLSGNQVFAASLAISLLGIVAGLTLWQLGSPMLEGRTKLTAYAVRFLAALVVAGMVVSFTGTWGLGVLILVIAILAISVTLSAAAE